MPSSSNVEETAIREALRKMHIDFTKQSMSVAGMGRVLRELYEMAFEAGKKSVKSVGEKED
jgi:hypothetical protein